MEMSHMANLPVTQIDYNNCMVTHGKSCRDTKTTAIVRAHLANLPAIPIDNSNNKVIQDKSPCHNRNTAVVVNRNTAVVVRSYGINLHTT